MGKRYAYYFCVGRHQKRTDCTLTHRPIELVEQQIEEHYRTVALSAIGLRQTGEAILEELAAEQLHLIEERKRAEERLRQLTDERMKLLQAHYVGAVPIDLLKTEQQRLTKEIKATERALRSNMWLTLIGWPKRLGEPVPGPRTATRRTCKPEQLNGS